MKWFLLLIISRNLDDIMTALIELLELLWKCIHNINKLCFIRMKMYDFDIISFYNVYKVYLSSFTMIWILEMDKNTGKTNLAKWQLKIFQSNYITRRNMKCYHWKTNCMKRWCFVRIVTLVQKSFDLANYKMERSHQYNQPSHVR